MRQATIHGPTSILSLASKTVLMPHKYEFGFMALAKKAKSFTFNQPFPNFTLHLLQDQCKLMKVRQYETVYTL